MGFDSPELNRPTLMYSLENYLRLLSQSISIFDNKIKPFRHLSSRPVRMRTRHRPIESAYSQKDEVEVLAEELSRQLKNYEQ